MHADCPSSVFSLFIEYRHGLWHLSPSLASISSIEDAHEKKARSSGNFLPGILVCYTHSKLAVLCLLMLTHISVCIVSIVRLFTLKGAITKNDNTWQDVGTSVWSSVELSVGVVCACLGPIKPLVVKFIPKLSSQASQYTRKTTFDASARSNHRSLYQDRIDRSRSTYLANGQTSTENLYGEMQIQMLPIDGEKKGENVTVMHVV